MQEAALENARSLLSPSAPSRLRSVFICPRISDAVAFRMQRPADIIYEVAPTSSMLFISDMALSRPLAPFCPYWPNRYWTSGFFVTIRDLGDERIVSGISAMETARPASKQIHDELQELFSVELLTVYHAVDPDLCKGEAMEAGRIPSNWGAPEITSTAPVTVMRVVEGV
ncbi:hypothetical protein D2T29_10745 [Sinirhodobacter populi]|uniref:Uncharacterized protein n=1 Tax=Paenirhodobacter populi TaxID=2306993 RepID=A0A443KFH1_9RHOB|nr:hypothetical protein [Sinirhodobacter populi]RWR31502.1 hypothetical protein D2T29_10745 [Sinirhodobacter populi]